MAIGLDWWVIKSVRADVVKQRARIVIEGRLDGEFMRKAEALRVLAGEELPVDVTVIERQPGLPMMRLDEVMEEEGG